MSTNQSVLALTRCAPVRSGKEAQRRVARAAARGHQVNAINSAARRMRPFHRLSAKDVGRGWQNRQRLSLASVKEFARANKAVTAVELGFFLPPTLVLLISTVQLGVIYVAQSFFDVAARDYFHALTTGFTSGQQTAKNGYDWMCARMLRSAFLKCEPAASGKQRLMVKVSNVSNAALRRKPRGYLSTSGTYAGSPSGYDSATGWNLPTTKGDIRLANLYYLYPVMWARFLADWANIPSEGHVLVRNSVFAKSFSSVPAFTGNTPILP